MAQNRAQRVSIAAAAEHYGVSTKTIRRMIADGRLPAYRVGRRLIRIDGFELTDWQRQYLEAMAAGEVVHLSIGRTPARRSLEHLLREIEETDYQVALEPRERDCGR